jgi:hypothetical protein
MQSRNVRPFRYVFGNQAKSRAGMPRAILHRWFAGELMGQGMHLHHALRVLTRRYGESSIPMQRRQACRRAVVVCGIEKDALRSAGRRTRGIPPQRRSDEQCWQDNGGDGLATQGCAHRRLLLTIEHWI